MAKSKHATALFEVIHKSKGLERPSRRQEAAPRGWFRRPPAAPVAAPVPSASAAGRTVGRMAVPRAAGVGVGVGIGARAYAAPGAAAPRVASSYESAYPADVEETGEETSFAGASRRSGGFGTPGASRMAAAVAASRMNGTTRGSGGHDGSQAVPLRAPVPRLPRLNFAVDGERSQVAFKLSYTTLLVGAFTAIVVVTLAVIVGKHISHGSSPVIAEATSEKIRKGPAVPGVMTLDSRGSSIRIGGGAAGGPLVTRPTTGSGSVKMPKAPAVASRAANGAGGATGAGAAPTFNEPRPPATLVSHDANRSIGLNYVVVQSYDVGEKAAADAMCATLCKNGFPCTVERDVPKWGGRLVVVGIDGFTGLSSPGYKESVSTLEKLSDKLGQANGGSGRRAMRPFQPVGYKWAKQTSETTGSASARGTASIRG